MMSSGVERPCGGSSTSTSISRPSHGAKFTSLDLASKAPKDPLPKTRLLSQNPPFSREPDIRSTTPTRVALRTERTAGAMTFGGPGALARTARSGVAARLGADPDVASAPTRAAFERMEDRSEAMGPFAGLGAGPNPWAFPEIRALPATLAGDRAAQPEGNG